ncbi:MAG: TonB-dependent receptor [Bacteroidetes bacterium]|nr:TonB-dependent receptor [Bacteroidota bacterium]
MLRILQTAIALLIVNLGIAQEIKINTNSVTLKELFVTIENQTEIGFVYTSSDFDASQKIELKAGTYQLADLITAMSQQTQLSFKLIDNYYVVTKLVAQQPISEKIYQTIRGEVVDVETGEGLPFATIYLENHPELGASTDINGKFAITAPLGRLNIQFSYLGYKPSIIPVLINTGQEPYLLVELEPEASALQGVHIVAEKDKAQTQNNSAYGSGRGFTVDEANKYAGTLGDPARMARSFAGVFPARDDRNDIIIRGNSPIGIQWRLDDIEIPNPNHFGGIGLTGNTTTLLNMNMLGNSDFLMGSFPSEYGNALSGVFDLHTKNINPERRQYRFQTGWNGFELGAEGPFSKKKNIGTYSLTYRYSFLDVVDAFGVDFGVLPKFQDITGKFNFNLSPKTSLSVLSIWGTSFIELDDHSLDADDMPSVGEYLRTGSDLFLAGANVQHRLAKYTVLKSGISIIDNQVKTQIDTFNITSDASNRVYTDNSGETKYSFFAKLERRKGKNQLRTGLRWDSYNTDYNSYSINYLGGTDTIHQKNDVLSLARLYVEDEYLLTQKLRVRAGLHGQYLLFNGSSALEPRFALRYNAAHNHAVSLSYGNHHSMQPRNIYFVSTTQGNEDVLTNKNLDFSAAHHLTFSYDYNITSNLRLKAESYYQHLYKIPIEADHNSTFSMSNVGADFYIPQLDSLVNEGLGRNYGIELTLERFLDKGFYYMLNGSAFRSEYQAHDDKWRSTAFDMKFTANALVGYEKWFGKMIAVGADFKLTYAGGKPYTPVNETASKMANEVVYYQQLAFTQRHPNYFRSDLKIYYRINYKKAYTEFAMDLQNLTNHKNLFAQEYDVRTGQYTPFYHMTFFPMFTFRCLF